MKQLTMKIIIQIVVLMIFSHIYNNAVAENGLCNQNIAYLLNKIKDIKWDTSSLISADVAWDVKKDFVVIGKTETEIVLAIVNGANTKKYQLIRLDAASSFCTPEQIKTLVLPNQKYKANKSKYKRLGIVLDDESCDPNIINWNKKSKDFELFRN